MEIFCLLVFYSLVSLIWLLINRDDDEWEGFGLGHGSAHRHHGFKTNAEQTIFLSIQNIYRKQREEKLLPSSAEKLVLNSEETGGWFPVCSNTWTEILITLTTQIHPALGATAYSVECVRHPNAGDGDHFNSSVVFQQEAVPCRAVPCRRACHWVPGFIVRHQHQFVLASYLHHIQCFLQQHAGHQNSTLLIHDSFTQQITRSVRSACSSWRVEGKKTCRIKVNLFRLPPNGRIQKENLKAFGGCFSWISFSSCIFRRHEKIPSETRFICEVSLQCPCRCEN